MALFRRRPAPSQPAVVEQQQAVLLHYAIGVRKSDLDRFLQVQDVLLHRLGRLGLGMCDGNDLGGGEGTVVLLGPDCHAMWDAAERAVAVCPLLPTAVELRPGGPDTPVVRIPVPDPQGADLRPRLELTSEDEVVRRRLTAFDLLLRLEAMQEGGWLILTEVGDSETYVQCLHQGERWVLERRAGSEPTHEHAFVPGVDEVLDALQGWAVDGAEDDATPWVSGMSG